MLALVCFILNIYNASKTKSGFYLLLYQIFVLIAISTFIAQGVDVTYKVDLLKPSDTAMYYKTYIDLDADITQNIFPAFIYYLRIIEFPFHHALFVVWGQATITFFIVDLIVRNKKNLLFICFFHALIYTNVGMFKDNFVIILSLLAFLFLTHTKRVLFQVVIICGTVWLLSKVRPFLFNFMIPLSIIPFWCNIKSDKLKKISFVCICGIGVVVWVMMQSYISGIMNLFENDSSVVAGRASPPIAIIKVLAGPTPIHYLQSGKYMMQPFNAEQSVLYFVYHILYYYVCAFWIFYVVKNYSTLFQNYAKSTAKTFLLGLAGAQGLVYVVIYGSADIRQRAIIILLLFLSTLTQKNIFRISDTIENRLAISSLWGFFLLITILNS